MKQILQNLRTGRTEVAEVPCPAVKHGHLLIRTTTTLVSAGTERMLVSFGQASLLGKARAQPDRVRQVWDKIRTDGLVPTLEAVFNKLDQPLPLGYCNVGIVMDVGEDVESGSTLSEAFGKHPKAFDRLYVNMVKAGEAGGALEIILQRLADFKEKAQSLKRKITGAMVYPIAVITVAVGILSFIMVYIIPKFEKIFKDFDMKLPELTQWLMNTSHWFATYWYVLPLFPLCWWLLIKLIRLNRLGNYCMDRLWLWTPIVGTIIEKTVIARTMRTLGTLVSSGVPILEALSITRETTNNAVFEKMYQRVHDSIREGETIAQPMKEARLVDDMVVNMIDVGEETGELDTMLNKIADVYDEEVNVLVESLISLLEPLMIVVLGLIVGTIVIALFLPMIKLLENLSKS